MKVCNADAISGRKGELNDMRNCRVLLDAKKSVMGRGPKERLEMLRDEDKSRPKKP